MGYKREVTCLLVGFYCLLILWGLAALAAGPERWNGFLESQQNLLMVIVHAIAFPIVGPLVFSQ